MGHVALRMSAPRAIPPRSELVPRGTEPADGMRTMQRWSWMSLVLLVACDASPAVEAKPADVHAIVSAELGQLAGALERPFDELRKLDVQMLAAADAMTREPEHKLEHFGTLRMRCADADKLLGDLQLDATRFTAAPVKHAVEGLLRGRDGFTRSQASCQGFDCPAACAQAWTQMIDESRLAARLAADHGVVIAPIRAQKES
jgi:hypothetical protein